MFRCLKRGPGFYGYLWRLTGPIALQNLITFSLGLIDTLMVSWLGNTQMAAVTTANVPVFLLISIVFGVQSGLGILVSQYWGKKDMESISRAIGVAAMLGTGITLVLAVVLFLWPVQIMDLLSNKHELSVLGAPYLKLIGFSYVFNMLSSIYVSAMRSAENAGFGMKLFGVSTLLNTGMNYILIFGKCGFPALGIQGAAIATLLSRVAEFLICLVCAMRSRILPLDLAAFFRPGWEMLRRFVKYSTPVILNETAWGLGNSLLTVILGYTDNSVEMLAANAVMGNLNPLLRDTADFTHKLWDHLFIMSDFQLDVDSPYPQPSRQELTITPRRMAYTQGRISYKHYGKYVEQMIAGLSGEKDRRTMARTVDNLARYMRTKSYEYNQEHPNNEVIVKDIKRMSGGAIEIDEVALNNLRSDYKQHFTARPQKGPQQRQQQRPQKNRNQQHGRNFSKNNGAHRNSSK